MAAAVEFENVSKHYRGANTYRSLREDVGRAARMLVGRRPPHPAVAALEDVTFAIEEGSTTAIVGINGAGKSTALKMISRITYPSNGTVRVRGRVGALIEVGAGLHPELTGRENIDLYGRILGFHRRQLRERFDEIAAFADIGAAMEQPVKHFSSGMVLRLGFAIASHLEPAVLLVDEALSVGDAGFQHRCFERMATLAAEGRTLILVTHDMRAVERLCARAILLERGQVREDGPAHGVVQRYLTSVGAGTSAPIQADVSSTEGFSIVGVALLDNAGEPIDVLHPGEGLVVRTCYDAQQAIDAPTFELAIADRRLGYLVHAATTTSERPSMVLGRGHVDCIFESLPLRPRSYDISVAVRGASGGRLHASHAAAVLAVSASTAQDDPDGVAGAMTGPPLRLPCSWKFG